jgi:hypothetical protein
VKEHGARAGEAIARKRIVNEREFKQHLKDLAHGHHHPEEHDWQNAGAAKKKPASQASRGHVPASRKSSKKK